MTDFRAELQRLVEAYDEHGGKWPDHHEQALFQAVEDARAALAQPAPVLTRPKCFGFAMSFLGDPEETEVRRYVEALEARSTINPVPVSERLPGPEDCDSEGRCWMFDPCDRGWWAYRSALPSDEELGQPPWTHWLPHWAMPAPAIAAELEAQ